MHALVVALLLAPSAAPTVPWTLTDEDRRFLNGLFAFLVNPVGADRVSVPVLTRWPDGVTEVTETTAWRFPGGERKSARIVNPDGGLFLPLGGSKRIDFVTECKEWLGTDGVSMPLERVAWLFRLGQENLAARLLASIKDREAAVHWLRMRLALSDYEAMANAFIVRADSEALVHGERLLRLYPAEALKFKQVVVVVGDLKRRKTAGTFASPKPFRPPGFERWPIRLRVAHLIDCLEDAGRRERYVLHWHSFHNDERVRALVEIGEAAVPALLDVVEKDDRLTRYVAFVERDSEERVFLPVREAALEALLLILRAKQILGELSARDGGKAASETLRAYWKRYGGLRTHERMMAHLLDRTATPEARDSAASVLAHLGSELEHVWFPRDGTIAGRRPKRPNPALLLDGRRQQRPCSARWTMTSASRSGAGVPATTSRRFDPGIWRMSPGCVTLDPCPCCIIGWQGPGRPSGASWPRLVRGWDHQAPSMHTRGTLSRGNSHSPPVMRVERNSTRPWICWCGRTGRRVAAPCPP